MKKPVPDTLVKIEYEEMEIYNYTDEERDKYISGIFERTKKKMQINEQRERKSYKLAGEFKTSPII